MRLMLRDEKGREWHPVISFQMLEDYEADTDGQSLFSVYIRLLDWVKKNFKDLEGLSGGLDETLDSQLILELVREVIEGFGSQKLFNSFVWVSVQKEALEKKIEKKEFLENFGISEIVNTFNLFLKSKDLMTPIPDKLKVEAGEEAETVNPMTCTPGNT